MNIPYLTLDVDSALWSSRQTPCGPLYTSFHDTIVNFMDKREDRLDKEL